mmetsp:Transcript_33087/g.65642  ORF Transcript_33087/g.65642 Transcript_33087/m.65642 type:complete len:129 (-) Transcript_33087:564-950(-)
MTALRGETNKKNPFNYLTRWPLVYLSCGSGGETRQCHFGLGVDRVKQSEDQEEKYSFDWVQTDLRQTGRDRYSRTERNTWTLSSVFFFFFFQHYQRFISLFLFSLVASASHLGTCPPVVTLLHAHAVG